MKDQNGVRPAKADPWIDFLRQAWVAFNGWRRRYWVTRAIILCLVLSVAGYCLLAEYELLGEQAGSCIDVLGLFLLCFLLATAATAYLEAGHRLVGTALGVGLCLEVLRVFRDPWTFRWLSSDRAAGDGLTLLGVIGLYAIAGYLAGKQGQRRMNSCTGNLGVLVLLGIGLGAWGILRTWHRFPSSGEYMRFLLVFLGGVLAISAFSGLAGVLCQKGEAPRDPARAGSPGRSPSPGGITLRAAVVACLVTSLVFGALRQAAVAQSLTASPALAAILFLAALVCAPCACVVLEPWLGPMPAGPSFRAYLLSASAVCLMAVIAILDWARPTLELSCLLPLVSGVLLFDRRTAFVMRLGVFIHSVAWVGALAWLAWG
jgi:hypothetical protein